MSPREFSKNLLHFGRLSHVELFPFIPCERRVPDIHVAFSLRQARGVYKSHRDHHGFSSSLEVRLRGVGPHGPAPNFFYRYRITSSPYEGCRKSGSTDSLLYSLSDISQHKERGPPGPKKRAGKISHKERGPSGSNNRTTMEKKRFSFLFSG